MNWNVILTTVGVLTTLVIFTPIFSVIALAYQKGKMQMTMEVMEKYHEKIHPNEMNIDWNEIFEGDKK